MNCNYRYTESQTILDVSSIGLLVKLSSLECAEKVSDDCLKISGVNYNLMCAQFHLTVPVLSRLLKSLKEKNFIHFIKTYGKKRGVTMCYIINLDPSNNENSVTIQKIESDLLSSDNFVQPDDSEHTKFDLLDYN